MTKPPAPSALHRFSRPPLWLWGLWLSLLLWFLLAGEQPNKSWLHTLSTVGLFAGLAVGLNMVVGFAGLLDLGFIAFFGIGAYTAAILTNLMPTPWWWLWATIPLCAGVAAFFGVLLGAPTLRLRGDYLAIVTLGFGEIIRLVFTHWDGLTNGPKGLSGIQSPRIGSVDLGLPMTVGGRELPPEFLLALLVLGTLSVLYHLAQRLSESHMGRAWRAIRDNELAAASLGINPSHAKLVAFGAGAAFAGVCGALFAAIQGFIDPTSFVFFESAMVLSMVVLGGMGKSLGAVTGAAVLIVLPVYFQEIHWGGAVIQTSQYRMLIMGAVLMAMMALRPQGLVGEARR